MVRSEDDTWDLAGKVGSTALATAMVRAAETLRDDRLFADPFAQRFIDAAVAQGWQNPYGTDAWKAKDYDDPAVALYREASTNGASSVITSTVSSAEVVHPRSASHSATSARLSSAQKGSSLE